MVRLFQVLVVFLIISGTVSVTYAAFEVYREGDYGQEITAIQKQLIKLGYSVGSVDGSFGKQTASAVKAFQKDNGLAADGVIGPQTYKALMGQEITVSRDSSAVIPRRVIQTALLYTGVPYVFGGTTPDGFDCSGFVQFVFSNSGIMLPRTADLQYQVGQTVAFSRLQPGDLVFFTTYAPGASHDGIYLGDGQFISATSSRGIAIDRLDSKYWGTRYIGARRIL